MGDPGGGTGTLTSPWAWTAADFAGKAISVTVTFSNSTLALIQVTVNRDPACLYKHIYFGLGTDGTPDTTTRAFTVPAGATLVSAATLAAYGFTTMTDVLAGQITAGP